MMLLGFLLLPTITPTISISPYLGLVGGSVCGLILGLMLSLAGPPLAGQAPAPPAAAA